MTRSIYNKRFSDKELDKLAVVEFVHTDWDRRDDHLFNALINLLGQK